MFDRKRDAEAWQAEMKSRVMRDDLGLGQPDMPIQEALEQHLQALKRTTIKHRRNVQVTILSAIRRYRLKTLRDLQPAVLERHKQDSANSLSTIKRDIILLKGFGGFLERSGLLSKNPVQKVKGPQGKPPEKRALTEDEVALLLEAMHRFTPKLHPIIFFIAYTGLRKMEAVTLEWDDIDFRHKMVHIHNKPHVVVNGEPFYCKWGSERTIPLKLPVIKLLMGLKRRTNWVFPNEIGGLNCHNFNRDFDRAKYKSGIVRPNEISPHTLRHTWISQLLANGVDLKSVSMMAGHKNLSTTAGYAHLIGGAEKMHLDIDKLPDFEKCTRSVPANKRDVEPGAERSAVNL